MQTYFKTCQQLLIPLQDSKKNQPRKQQLEMTINCEYLVPHLRLGVHTNAALRSLVVSLSIFAMAACFVSCWSSSNLAIQ
jgi:hypothetical protein